MVGAALLPLYNFVCPFTNFKTLKVGTFSVKILKPRANFSLMLFRLILRRTEPQGCSLLIIFHEITTTSPSINPFIVVNPNFIAFANALYFQEFKTEKKNGR